MHGSISYKPSRLPHFVTSLLQKCWWPFIGLRWYNSSWYGWRFSSRSLHFGHSSYPVKGHTISFWWIQIRIKTGLATALQSHSMLPSVNSYNKQHFSSCFSGWLFFIFLLFIFTLLGPHTQKYSNNQIKVIKVMNVFIMITCKRPLMGAFCVSSFTKLPTSFIAIRQKCDVSCLCCSIYPPKHLCSTWFSNSLYLK